MHPLGGVDFFHLVRDGEMRGRGLAGNHCLYALDLEGRVDERAVTERVARAQGSMEELRYRLARGFPPRWVEGDWKAEVTLRPAGTTLEELLEVRIDGARPWAFDVIRGRDHDTVVLRWFHPLADGKAAERLVRFIGSADATAPELRMASGERLIEKLDRKEKYARMKAYNQHVIELAKAPIASPATHLPSSRSFGKTRVIRVLFDEAETRAFDARVRDVAKLAETSLIVVAAVRALDAVMIRRGLAPFHYLVPVPLSLDPKAGATRMFGNHLTMMMFLLARADLDDERAAVAKLAEQQRAIVRQKLDVGMLAALDLARWLPSPVYRLIERVPTHGEMASLIVSNPGAVGIDTFLGVRVADARPVPAVVLPPGAQVIATRFRGRLSVQLVYVEGALLEEEALAMTRALKAEILPKERA